MCNTMLRAGILAILTVGLVLSGNASARPQEKKAAKNSTTASGDVLTSLHQAKTLLDTAIHDYDGHRAKAVEEIHHAIRELSPHHKGGKGTGAAATTKEAEKVANNANAPNNAGAKGTTPGETQAQSDKQLKQALQILSGLDGQIPAAHPKASQHLTNAVSELNAALKIK